MSGTDRAKKSAKEEIHAFPNHVLPPDRLVSPEEGVWGPHDVEGRT